MALTLITEVAGKDSNCYVSLAEALTYISDERLDDPPLEWTAADDAKKAKALARATKEIDAKTGGVKWRPIQALRFPRTVDVKAPYLFPWVYMGYNPFTPPELPKPVKEATVELALYLISRPADATMRESLQAQGVSSTSLGKISETYRHQGGRSVIDSCPVVVSLLRQVGYGGPVALG